jgi:hypothetical protein
MVTAASARTLLGTGPADFAAARAKHEATDAGVRHEHV